MISALARLRASPLFILIALLAGLVAGMALGAVAPGHAASLADFLDPVGALWLRALQMTIIPLVFALLVTGIVSAVAAARASKMAGWAIALFFAILWSSAIMAAIVTPLLLQWWPAPAAAAQEAVRAIATHGEGLGADAATVPALGEFIKAMIPTNPIAAAASDAVLPLLIFAALFALAITRLSAEQRDLLAQFFAALGNAMLVIIGWVLALAPIGVFALAYVVAARIGAESISVFLHYILVVTAVGTLVWIAAYPLAVFVGKVSPARFARAVLPAQAVAISTQSSIASLPAMLRGTGMIGVPAATADVTLPLSVALFRATGPAMNLAVAIYVAYLTGVELTPLTLAIGVAMAATTTLGSVSLPGSISFISAIGPIALAMGVPIEPLALLLAVEQLPDIMRTLGNVTMDVAVTGIVSRKNGDVPDEAAENTGPISSE